MAEALDARAPLRLLLLARGAPAAARAVAERVRAAGVAVREASDNDLRRMARDPAARDLLGLVGPDPSAAPEAVLAERGVAWLLAGVAYAGNAGFAIRTAEVSGADAIFLDSPLDPEGRRRALRASMHAERFFPVHWKASIPVIEAARRAGRRVVAIESDGDTAPWDADLGGPLLLVLGDERRGLELGVLDRCETVVRIPMAGFIPSYNVQAAMAAVAAERLRQGG